MNLKKLQPDNAANLINVPFLDLSATYQELKAELDQAYTRVMTRGHYIKGQELDAFEQEFATYCEASHCIGVANGLDAIRLILMGLGIGPGDEVIVPAHTFIATWLAVTEVGATLVPVEVDINTYQIDPNLVETAITPKTKAVIAVHLYGHPADMPKLKAICDQHKIHLIEDAAQAHGATINGQKTGSWGTAAAFSFYPGKNLGCYGDGGAVTTNNAELARTIRMIGNYGTEKKYHHEIIGLNSRLDELQAAFLRVRLNILDKWNARRTKIAAYYSAHIKNEWILPRIAPNTDPVWHLYVVRVPGNRDKIIQDLAAHNITALIHYPIPCHKSECYPDMNALEFPISEQIADTVLSLPIGPHFSDTQIEHVAKTLSTYF